MSKQQIVDQSQARILDKYRPFPEFAWMHYIIRDRMPGGTRAAVPRCDKYSDYATSEPAVWLYDVQKILREHIENFPFKRCTIVDGKIVSLDPSLEEITWLHDLMILIGRNAFKGSKVAGLLDCPVKQKHGCSDCEDNETCPESTK